MKFVAALLCLVVILLLGNLFADFVCGESTFDVAMSHNTDGVFDNSVTWQAERLALHDEFPFFRWEPVYQPVLCLNHAYLSETPLLGRDHRRHQTGFTMPLLR